MRELATKLKITVIFYVTKIICMKIIKDYLIFFLLKVHISFLKINEKSLY